uniref:Uncharacterized protein n=1 Tax=viral metagenome TaxID=1070528 RepID=A0A6C0KVK5_9ZZZZ
MYIILSGGRGLTEQNRKVEGVWCCRIEEEGRRCVV